MPLPVAMNAGPAPGREWGSINLGSLLMATRFNENSGWRIVIEMFALVAGGVVLSWPTDGNASDGWSALVLGIACLFWAIDNNLTRKVSASDALFIAASKGGVAGMVNTVLALLLGTALPSFWVGLGTMAGGLVG
jgi:hypothetical protein